MTKNCLTIVREVLKQESSAIDWLSRNLDESVTQVVELLFECRGRLIITGMGKMGQIARKATATFCSTGSPALFLHPGEAVHGDLGIVTAADILIALSCSGETEEVTGLLPFMKRYNVPVVAITARPDSDLGKRSTHVLDIGVEVEAEPITRAPTTSTTVTLALCDALAVALMRRRGFTAEQFAIFHPGGSLGKKMLLTVADVMHVGDRIPTIGAEAKISEAIFTMSQKGLGAAFIVDSADCLIGIFTDGDLRRTFENSENPLQDPLEKWMTHAPIMIDRQALAAEALRAMEDREITVLPVSDSGRTLVGVVHLHDLLRVGLA